MNRSISKLHAPRVPLAWTIALILAAMAAPAWADPACQNPDGTPVEPAPGTDQGNEHGDNNTTCTIFSSTYGENNRASGEAANAFGNYNNARSLYSNAFGSSNTASSDRASAFGYRNTASGSHSSAFGTQSTAAGARSLAMAGWYDRNGDGFLLLDIDTDGDGFADSSSETAIASGTSAVALGAGVAASGDRSSAVGVNNTAAGTSSSAFGYDNAANGSGSTAMGTGNTTTGFSSVALGSGNLTIAGQSVAVGMGNVIGADASAASAFGVQNNANGVASTAIGFRSVTNARHGLAMGYHAEANALGALASGRYALADGAFSVAVGNWTGADLADPVLDLDLDGDGTLDADSRQTIAHGSSASAFGPGALALADDSVAIGQGARANVAGAVAIGANAVADRANSVSVGTVGSERQIVNVADATEATDAVNLGQLVQVGNALATGVAGVLGGGATWNPQTGTFTAPTYVIQNGNYNNVGSAFAAVDGAIDDINERIVAVGGVQGEQGESAYEVAVSNGFAGTQSDWLDSLQGDQGPSGPTGPEGPAGGGPRSVVYDSDDQASLTLGGANGTRISNVANGVAATDAANVGQMQAGDADTLQAANEYTNNTATETLTSANAYTDQRFAELTGLSTDFEAFRGEVDDRFRQQDRRIDRMSSISGAYAGMAMNTSGLAGRNRVGVGVGAQGGERALAVGYQRAIGNRASVSIAGAFSGDEKSVSAGAGFSW